MQNELLAASAINKPLLREDRILALIQQAPRRQPTEVFPCLYRSNQQLLRLIYDTTQELTKKPNSFKVPEGLAYSHYLQYAEEFILADGRSGDLFVKLEKIGRGSYNAVYKVEIVALYFQFTEDDVWSVEPLALYQFALRRPNNVEGRPEEHFSYDNDAGLRSYITNHIPGVRVPTVYDYGCFPNDEGPHWYMVEEYIPSTPFGYAFEDKPPTTGMRKEELLEQLATCMVAFMLDETTATISGIGPRPAADAIGGIHWDFVEGKAFLGKLVNKSILAFPTTRKLIEGSEPRLEKQVVEDKNRAHKANIIHRGGWRHLVNNSMLPPDDPTLPYNPGPYFDYISWGLSCLSRELLYHRSEYKNLRKILPPNVIPGFEGIKYKRFINLLDGHIRSQLEAYKTDPSYAVKYNHTAICHMDFHGNNVLISDADDQIVLIDWDLNGLLPIHNQYPEDRLTKLFVWERSQWEPQEIRKAVAANRKYTGMLKAKIERICQERGMSPRKIRQALGKGKSALGPYGDPFVEFVASSEMTTPERYFQYIYFDDRRWRKTLVQKGLGYFWMGVYRLEYELGAISEDWKPVLLVFAALLFAVWMLASYWPYMLLFAVVLLYIIIGRTTPVLFQVTPRNSEIDGSDNNRAVKLLMPLWTVILPILFQLILSSQPITIYPQPSLPLFRWPLDWFWLQSGLTSLTFLVCFALLCWTGILWWFLRMDWKIYSWGLRKWYHLFCNSSREDWGKAGALVLGGCLIWRAFTGAFPWGLITLISDIAAFWGVVSILWTILGYAWYRFFGMRIHNMTGRVLDDDVDEVGEK